MYYGPWTNRGGFFERLVSFQSQVPPVLSLRCVLRLDGTYEAVVRETATGKLIASAEGAFGFGFDLEACKQECMEKVGVILRAEVTDIENSGVSPLVRTLLTAWPGRKLVNTKVEVDDDDGSPRTTLVGTVGTIFEVHEDRIGVVFENGAMLFYSPHELLAETRWL